MSDLAIHVLKLSYSVKSTGGYGSGLTPEFRFECLQACAARLIMGEYNLGETQDFTNLSV